MDESKDSLNLADRVTELERQVASLEARLSHEISPEAPDEVFRETEAAAPPPLRRSPAPSPVAPKPGRPVRPESPPPRRAEPQPQEERPEEMLHDFRATLRKLKLWPPEGEGNLEVQVGAWWATRIGALLAVIGVVFFGMYVAHGTPPWARLLQLTAVALGVTAAGHWLERKEAKFGAVVFGSGLALIFFTGFAAYTVPAVKIIGQPLVAVALQGAMVAAIVAAAFWKNRSNLATMAILFGFVTCLFSFLEQLQDISLVAAFLLAAAAAALWLGKGWLPPLACSVPAASVIYGAIVLFGWAGGNAPSFAVALAFPVATFVLFTAADYAGKALRRPVPQRERRVLQGLNAGGAAGLGLLATTRYFGDFIVEFYLLFSVLFLLSATAYYLRERDDELAHIWFAAGMGFLALGLIEILDARTRWIALAVQSAGVLYTARRTRLWTAEAMMGVLWLGSAGLFVYDTAGAGFFQRAGGIWSLWGAAATVYLILSAVLLSLQARLLKDRPIVPGAEETGASKAGTDRGRRQLNALYAAVFGGVACAAAFGGFPTTHLPAGALAAAVLLAAIGVTAGHWLALAAACLPFVVGQWSFWSSPSPAELDWAVWLNGGLAIGSALAVAAAVQLAARHERLPNEFSKASVGLAHGFWLISVQAFLFKTASFETNLLIAALLGLALLALAGGRRLEYLADLVPAPVTLALVSAGFARWEGLANLPATGNAVLLWPAAIGVFGAVSARDCWSRLTGLTNLFPAETFARAVGAVTATILGLFVVGREFDYPFMPAAIGLSGLLVLLLRRWPGWSPAAWSALVFLLVGQATFLTSPGLARGDELVWPIALATCTLIYAVLVGNPSFVRQARAAISLQSISGALAMGSLFLLFLTHTGPLEPYTTVFWGMSAIGVFAAGLVWRAKPLRVMGLIGLGLCLPRIFLVDIHSTFYRIAAFVAVGAVLLVVGFLYHKFRNRIAGVLTTAEEKT